MTAVKEIDGQLEEKIQLWLSWDQNNCTREEVEKLVNEKAFSELQCRMMKRISFGTAGLRGFMGAGFACMNDLVVIQAAQGLCNYLLELKGEPEKRSIVVGYDVRHNSRRFAELTANVFLRKNIKVYFFSKYVATPVVSYAVMHYKSDIGVMVTASHNPKQDNGYKVYWDNGAQLTSPHDAVVLQHIEKCLDPWPGSWDTSTLNDSPLRVDCLNEICKLYNQDSGHYCFFREANSRSKEKFTFSPVHGVGKAYVVPMLSEFGFDTKNLVMVREQADPDPDFPTTPFPNPEEGEKVLKWAMKTAEENESKIILCTDPDADRFQMAELQLDGKWYIFTGNEMGTLLTWWLWQNRKRINDKIPDRDFYIVNSTVSTKFAQTMSKKEGFGYEETLTGFKWLANRAHELRQQGKVVLLAWEESIGYMPGKALDKDGVVTCAIFADFATYLHNKQMNFVQQLEAIYSQYGLHLCYNTYLRCPSSDRMIALFNDLRSVSESSSGYATKFGDQNIKFVRDLNVGYDNSRPKNKPILPWGASNFMITFTLESGSVFTIRGSGTEPKIKYYVEIILSPEQSSDSAEGKRQLEIFKKIIVEDFFQPEKYGFEMR